MILPTKAASWLSVLTLVCRLLRLLLIRFPERTFIFVGDSGYRSHKMARFCHQHRNHLNLASKLHLNANWHQSNLVW